ncbi:hypothetical protein [Spongiimicrobium salis]|uniref:hypothetical protein n=1 Tax=Spongiimicrobium salis TaxID=1667022 RepID=UPI00374DC0D8
MNLKLVGTFFAFLFFNASGYSQECALGIGTGDAATIVQIFQLNEEQIAQLGEWREALLVEVEKIETEIKTLFETEPQSTKEELSRLAAKHDVLEQKLIKMSIAYDTKLINVFNERQYERYKALCFEALREPIPQSPENKKDPE